MASSARELVLAALNGQAVERVPVGFWFHFHEGPEKLKALENPEIVEENLAGHAEFLARFKPDFVKIMTDGFFVHPDGRFKGIRSVEDLRALNKVLKPLAQDHPWFDMQVAFVRKLREMFGPDMLLFYNVIAPIKFLHWFHAQEDHDFVARLAREDRDALKHALAVVAQDGANLSRRIITEGGADGIYLCVQSVQNPYMTKEIYQDAIGSSQLAVLEAANSCSDINLMHICGFKGFHNDISWFASYPAKGFNWAVNVEGVSLAEGREIFGGRCVIGGFDETEAGCLYKGSRGEVEAFTDGLIRGAGKRGVIIGADCTVPNDIDPARFEWVREKAAGL